MSQIEQASHSCAACGGSGWDFSDKTRVLPRHCPVCLCAGTISDRMPARDAVADAETLRREGQVHKEGSFRTDPASGRKYRRMAWYLPMRDIESIKLQSPEVAAYIVATAARAAFRAVPGLRGDQ